MPAAAALPPALVTLTSSTNPATVRQTVTLTATVSGSPGGPAPTGTVTFFDASATALCQAVPLGAGGKASCVRPLVAGERNVWARYDGDLAYLSTLGQPVFQRVIGDPSSVVVSSAPNPSVSGQPVTFRARVSAQIAGAPMPTGTVDFDIEGVDCSRRPVLLGEATCVMPMHFGTFPFTATYLWATRGSAAPRPRRPPTPSARPPPGWC